MAIAIIDNWVNDPKRSYEYGVQLYEQFGDNRMILALLKNGHARSHYHFTRLTDALRTLIPKQPAAAATAIAQQKKLTDPLAKLPKLEEISVSPQRYSLTDADWEKLPNPIKDLYTRQSRLHAHSQMLFNQSRISTDHEHRRIIDCKILHERNELNNNWQTIKDFHTNGAVKAEVQKKQQTEIDKLSIAELVKLSKNLPPALSKKRKRLTGMQDGAQKNKLIATIKELEIRQELVKKRLEDK